MNKYMLLFRIDPGYFKTVSPEQMQQTLNKWMDWKNRLEQEGHLDQFGDRLQHSGKVICGKTKEITDGPFIEVKDAVQGYLVLQTETLEQASELALGCPVLDQGGSVEIRPLIKTD